jgi:hypothetical protein
MNIVLALSNITCYKTSKRPNPPLPSLWIMAKAKSGLSPKRDRFLASGGILGTG